jgi:hypothetical protein
MSTPLRICKRDCHAGDMVIVDPVRQGWLTRYPPTIHRSVTLSRAVVGASSQTSGWGRGGRQYPKPGGDGAPPSHKVRPIASLPTTAERSDDVVDLNATEPSTNDDAAILGPPNADGGE